MSFIIAGYVLLLALFAGIVLDEFGHSARQRLADTRSTLDRW